MDSHLRRCHVRSMRMFQSKTRDKKIQGINGMRSFYFALRQAKGRIYFFYRDYWACLCGASCETHRRRRRHAGLTCLVQVCCEHAGYSTCGRGEPR
jgi:hypothetical protein